MGKFERFCPGKEKPTEEEIKEARVLKAFHARKGVRSQLDTDRVVSPSSSWS